MRRMWIPLCIAGTIGLSVGGCKGDDDGDEQIPNASPTPTTDADLDGFPLSEDCNDTSASIYPGAPETCNNKDDDCDGQADDAGSEVQPTWYADADGDGYGVNTTSLHDCKEPAGYADNADDCDDSNAALHPDQEEICGDGVDNNCDGDATGCGLAGSMALGDAATAFSGSTDGEKAGWAVSGAGDVNGDGLADILVSAPYSDSGASGSGTVYLIYGREDMPSSLNLNDADASFPGTISYEAAGYALAAAGDLNRDGYDDILIGVPYHDVPTDSGTLLSGGGIAYVFYGGNLQGELSLANADAAISGTCSACVLGSAVAGGGDLNGDGYPDIVLGAHGYDSPDDPNTTENEKISDVGAAYVFYGPVAGKLTADDADAQVVGTLENGGLGQSVAFAGDPNQDGAGDLLLGASDYAAHGAAFLFNGPLSSTQTELDADASFVGETEDIQAGSVVSGVGDVDGDGVSDLAVTAPYDSVQGAESGSVYLFYGPVNGEKALSKADAILIGSSVGEHAGYALAPAGDVNADGYADLLIGTRADDKAFGAPARHVYITFGPLAGLLNLSEADVTISPEDSTLFLGHSVSLSGDVNGDTFADILCGVPERSDDSDFQGRAYLFLGAPGI